jgi:hypothetical protein
MRLIIASAVAALLCASTAAFAAGETAPTAAQGEEEAQAEKPKKICRMETGTGSVMPKRVCRTPEQVAADQEAARRTRDEMNRSRGM